MGRSGPITIHADTIALGYAQIRVGNSADNIGNIEPALTVADSIGALASTTFRGPTDWFKLESGFPLITDYVTPTREAAQLECAFKEITPANMALANGYDPGQAPYSDMTPHSGELPLGGRTAPDYVRMEAVYTYTNGTSWMHIIFPRSQVSATPELALASEDAAAVTLVFESQASNGDVSGGDVVWDSRPLGRIVWTESGEII